MKLLLASIAARAGSGPAQALLSDYVARLSAYSASETKLLPDEEALLAWVGRLRARTPPLLVLLDSRGRQLSSEELATWLLGQQDAGRQLLLFAVGPPDGWTERARSQAGLLLSLGPMTLPHEIARVVVAEQLYRAFTILKGHPYHCGHTRD